MTDIIYMVFGLTFGAGLGWLIAKVQTTVEKRRSAAPKKNLPGDRSLTSTTAILMSAVYGKP